MPVTKRLRYEILRRDNHTCHYCGGTAPDVKLTVDHVTPSALGGSDEPTNLVAACVDCNAGKTSSNPDAPLLETVSADALRWSAAMKQAAEVQLGTVREFNTYLDAVDAKWRTWRCNGEQEVPRPDGWRNTIECWKRAGVAIEELLDAVDRAMGNELVKPQNTWRYTCGIVWTRLKQRQEMAQEILAKQETVGSDDDLDDQIAEDSFDAQLLRTWRLLQICEPRLADLERHVSDLCRRVLLGSDFDDHDVWYGEPDFMAQFGFGIKELFVDVIERCRYLDDEQKRDAQFYITRMISQSFESVRTS